MDLVPSHVSLELPYVRHLQSVLYPCTEVLLHEASSIKALELSLYLHSSLS